MANGDLTVQEKEKRKKGGEFGKLSVQIKTVRELVQGTITELENHGEYDTGAG